MSAQAILTTITPSHHTLLSPRPINPSNAVAPPLHSSFRGVSLKPTRQFLSVAVSVPKKPLYVLAATKKAVAVLKGDSKVEGVVSLTQEDDGQFFFFLNPSFIFMHFCDLGFWCCCFLLGEISFLSWKCLFERISKRNKMSTLSFLGFFLLLENFISSLILSDRIELLRVCLVLFWFNFLNVANPSFFFFFFCASTIFSGFSS